MELSLRYTRDQFELPFALCTLKTPLLPREVGDQPGNQVEMEAHELLREPPYLTYSGATALRIERPLRSASGIRLFGMALMPVE